MSYQGKLTSHNTNYTGQAFLKCALVDGGTLVSRPATATAVVNSGFITSFVVANGGDYYTSVPQVRITDPTGQGAIGIAQVSGGKVTAITVQDPGSGYSTTPTVTVDPPAPAYSYVSFWSNDGTSNVGSEPATAVAVSVTAGLFSINLGDTSLSHMTMLLAPEIFANADVRLRVWVSTGASFQMLSPDQRVTAAAYSLMAAKVADSAVVSSANLADLSVTTAKLANVAVTEGKIADTAVTSGKIANGAVGSAQLAANAVTSAKIADGAITDADISGSAAIAVSKIAGAAGVEFTGLGSLAGLSTTLTSLGSITLTCPASGYVIVTLSGDAVFAGDATIIDVGVGSSAAAFAGYVRVGRHDGTGQLRYVNSFSVERVFAVSAGNNTFHGLAQKESVFDANSVNLSDLYLTGVFIPARY